MFHLFRNPSFGNPFYSGYMGIQNQFDLTNEETVGRSSYLDWIWTSVRVGPSFMHLVTKRWCDRCVGYSLHTSQILGQKSETYYAPIDPMLRRKEIAVLTSSYDPSDEPLLVSCDSDHLDKQAFCLWLQTWSFLSSISICQFHLYHYRRDRRQQYFILYIYDDAANPRCLASCN